MGVENHHYLSSMSGPKLSSWTLVTFLGRSTVVMFDSTPSQTLCWSSRMFFMRCSHYVHAKFSVNIPFCFSKTLCWQKESSQNKQKERLHTAPPSPPLESKTSAQVPLPLMISVSVLEYTFSHFVSIRMKDDGGFCSWPEIEPPKDLL